MTPIRPGVGRPMARPAPVRAHRVPRGLPKSPPGWLSAPAKLAWRRLVPLVGDSFVESVDVLDTDALAFLCEHYAIAVAAAKEMRGRGNVPLVSVPDGGHGANSVKKNPAVQAFRDATKTWLELAERYGMTPKGRRLLASSVLPELDDDDDDADLFES